MQNLKRISISSSALRKAVEKESQKDAEKDEAERYKRRIAESYVKTIEDAIGHVLVKNVEEIVSTEKFPDDFTAFFQGYLNLQFLISGPVYFYI